VRREQREILDSGRQNEILDSAQVCRLALNDESHPYIVPVNFVRLGSRIYFHGSFEGHKMRLIARDARVSFEVDRLITVTADEKACRWGAVYESVVGRGVASLVRSTAEKELALRQLMAKYSGRGDWELPPREIAAVAVVRIDVREQTGKSSLQGR
jgi:nitroimidazol reductase NimA-like FMN-containing flavoprotein (pyridoxamine 5'-phosphate oxidase superfamily)